MPDISMCRQQECLTRYTCYRYMAVPDSRQSYIIVEQPKLCELRISIVGRAIRNVETVFCEEELARKGARHEPSSS